MKVLDTNGRILMAFAVDTIVPLSLGGAGIALTAVNGGVVYSGAASLGITAAGSAGQLLQSAGAATPVWTTATYPATTTANQLLYSSGANVVAGLATTASSILVTSAGGVPSLATDIPTAVTIGGAYVYRAGGTDVAATDGGTGLSVYAVGDILYAPTTTTVGRLAAVAVGQILASAGANTAPTWSASPTLTTSLTVPLLVGGTAVGSTLSLQSTSGVGTTDTIIFKVGNNGAIEAGRFITSGLFGLNRAVPGAQLDVLSGATDRITAIFDTAASVGVDNTIWKYNGTEAIHLITQSAATHYALLSRNLGNNVEAPAIIVGWNSNAGTEGPAAGVLRLYEAAAANHSFWVDGSGRFRTHTASPTGSSGTPTVADNAGTVVGDQTSWYALKNILGPAHTPSFYLSELLKTPVERFTYLDHSYNIDGVDQEFTGLVIRNRNEWFGKNYGRQQTPCLNEVNVTGYLVQSIKALQAQIDALKAQLN